MANSLYCLVTTILLILVRLTEIGTTEGEVAANSEVMVSYLLKNIYCTMTKLYAKINLCAFEKSISFGR